MIRSHRTPGSRRRAAAARGGFTLIELLVVIFIILLVSAVALPTVLPALNHRQMSEAGRILQGALVGARDKAIHDGQPSGIRLLPDPAFYSLLSTGQINPYAPLAYNRVIPIEPAPEYSEGMCTVVPQSVYLGSGGSALPITSQVTFTWSGLIVYPYALMLVQSAVVPGTGAPNGPTSWYWNVRQGDQVQINNAGPWYTVMGPVSIPTPEGYVNVGQPGTLSASSGVPLLTTAYGTPVNYASNYVEYLLLTNGVDDNQNGYVDEGWDGIDNDGDGITSESTCGVNLAMGEWEQETWVGSIVNQPANLPYTIRRRPVVASGAREISLPTDVVIDATTWNNPVLLNAPQERSRLLVNSDSGIVDLMVNPDGSVFYSTPYGVPTSMGMSAAFYHFWLAERQDVMAMQTNASGAPITWANGTAPYYLPIAEPGTTGSGTYPGPYLKGSYSVLTLFARTGQIAVNANPLFLDYSGNYNATYPFLQAEQGVNGGP